MNSQQSEDFLQLSVVDDDLLLNATSTSTSSNEDTTPSVLPPTEANKSSAITDEVKRSSDVVDNSRGVVENNDDEHQENIIYSHDDDDHEYGSNDNLTQLDDTPPPIHQQTTTSFHIDPKILNDMHCLFQSTRYFLIKSNNFQNVEIAKAHGAWSTTHYNEEKLNLAYKESANVILIFSVNDSGQFQGYARLASECLYDTGLNVDWILPPHLTANKHLSGVFKLDWITKNCLSFGQTQHLKNAWNEFLPVKIGRDGQEIEPQCGEELCRMFALCEDISMLDDHAKLNLVNEISHKLSVIVDKSKKRYAKLATACTTETTTLPSKPLAPITIASSDRSRNSSNYSNSNRSSGSSSSRSYNQNGQRYGTGGTGSYYGQYDGRYTTSTPAPLMHPNVPKEVILNSTYEEYLAAVTRGYQNYQQPPVNNHSMYATTAPPHDVYQASNSNYDKDVEEFLRKTNGSSNGHHHQVTTTTVEKRSRSSRSSTSSNSSPPPPPSSSRRRRSSREEKKHKKSRKERRRSRSRSNSSGRRRK